MTRNQSNEQDNQPKDQVEVIIKENKSLKNDLDVIMWATDSAFWDYNCQTKEIKYSEKKPNS